MSAALLISCSDPLQPRRTDPEFAAETAAARDLGAEVVLIDHDALLAGDAEPAVSRVPPATASAVYRGWMVPSDRYALLASALSARGVQLTTSAAAYRRAHELPGWYDVMTPVTPRSVWIPLPPGETPGEADLVALVAPLGAGPAVVKDYVKSRKHEWEEACFVPDLADARGLAAAVAGSWSCRRTSRPVASWSARTSRSARGRPGCGGSRGARPRSRRTRTPRRRRPSPT